MVGVAEEALNILPMDGTGLLLAETTSDWLGSKSSGPSGDWLRSLNDDDADSVELPCSPLLVNIGTGKDAEELKNKRINNSSI